MNTNVDRCIHAAVNDPTVPATIAAALRALAQAVQELGWAQQTLEWATADMIDGEKG